MDRKELSQVLLELVEEETGEQYTDVGEDTDLRGDMNLDSLDMVSVIFAIEGRFEIDIESSELGDVTTVGQMLNLLESKLQEDQQRKAA